MKGWTYMFDYGYSYEVWARGDRRRIIDKTTDRIVVEYTV